MISPIIIIIIVIIIIIIIIIIITYNSPFNFCTILLATLRHMVQITGWISRNKPHLHQYLSSDYFR